MKKQNTKNNINNNVLSDLFNILNQIEYFIESTTLLNATFNLNKKIIDGNTEIFNIGIEEFFEYDFLDLRSELLNKGFQIENHLGGYKIIGKSIKINVLVFKDIGDRLIYRYKDLSDYFKNYYVMKNDLFPIIKYKYQNCFMKGAKNPYNYLERVYRIKQNKN